MTADMIYSAAEMSEKASAEGLSAIIAGVAAMILIVIVTVTLPKIAAFVDRLFGREKAKPPAPCPERVEENYKVYDIYEGELNHENNDNDKKE